MSETGSSSIRVLVIARQPFSLAGFTDGDSADAFASRLIRRPSTLEEAIEDFDPNVLLVDTDLPHGAAIDVIGEALLHAPDMRVLALTPDPAPHDDVALAMRAGAAGYIDVDAEPSEFVAAIEAVHGGQVWLPGEETRALLGSVADDLDMTTAERRSRLTGIILALIPLTGLIATLQAWFWRAYLGRIGVRPVDLAVDPATRVLNAILALLLLIGIFGPLLLIGSWLDMLRESPANRGPLERLLRHRKTSQFVASVLWLVVASLLTVGPDLLTVLVIGPAVSVAILAKALALDTELPGWLQISNVSPRVALVGSLAALFLFIGALAYETVFVGPDLRDDGVHGVIAPKVLGFKAQPVRAIEVDTGEESDMLYLGGNADLYVLVDPCDDDRVDLVSVGARRLTVIDEVSCAPD